MKTILSRLHQSHADASPSVNQGDDAHAGRRRPDPGPVTLLGMLVDRAHRYAGGHAEP